MRFAPSLCDMKRDKITLLPNANTEDPDQLECLCSLIRIFVDGLREHFYVVDVFGEQIGPPLHRVA